MLKHTYDNIFLKKSHFSLLFVTSSEYSTSLILNDICAEQSLRRRRRGVHLHSHWDVNYKKGTKILPKDVESQIRTHWRRLFHSLGKKEERHNAKESRKPLLQRRLPFHTHSPVKKKCSCHSIFCSDTNKVSWNSKRRQTLKRSILLMKNISCQKNSFSNPVSFHVIYTGRKVSFCYLKMYIKPMIKVQFGSLFKIWEKHDSEVM